MSREAFTDDEIRDISLAVYKIRLGPAAVERVLERDGDGGKKLRKQAESYDVLTWAYLEVLGLHKPDPRVPKNKKAK